MMAFLDVETTKLMRRDIATDDRAQAWLVEAAIELCTMDGERTDVISRRVRLPNDASVQPGAEVVHGISTRQARRSGCTQRWAMYGLLECLNEARYAISYGTFDREVGASLIERVAGPEVDNWLRMWNRPGLEWINCITVATAACKIPSGHETGGYRYPSLDAAGEILCGLPKRDGQHRSLDDLGRLKSVFFALRERGMIEVAS
jgi:hypothetical protein